ncbi:hypothetical protein [Flavobacterium sp.]|uniref:hypothetical protein n=1 Tax=Flavobacterium sp. TaxID=239 RepID=UPI00352924FB
MKKIVSILILMGLFVSCSKDSNNNNNPYLPNYRFSSSTINLSLPLYTSLQSPGNAIVYSEAGVGIRDRVFILNSGSGFLAFDACCPNQELSACSIMELVGIKAVCPCDEVEYSLFSGQAPDVQYPMKQYRVEMVGEGSIRVYN